MRIIKYIFCAILFVGASFAENITINWMDGNTTYAQTTCTIGGDIILPETPTKRGYTFMGWNTMKVYSDGVELPVEYDRLEYIESTGTQYIDTGILPNIGTNIEIKVKANSVSSSASTILGGGNSWLNNELILSYQSNTLHFEKGNDNTITWSKAEILDTHTYAIQNSYALIDNVVKISSMKTTDINTINTIYIAAYHRNAGVGEYFSGNIYYCKLYNIDILVRYFIPVIRNSDNKPGLYDTITGGFFTNAGTGEFIAGPVVYE